ncbi:hypothetical protein [Flavobacterium sp.]|uniref:hypothetical protein n=1 Tax=Flavobacterium sp. TaxID=239 RepID=UPI0038FD052C
MKTIKLYCKKCNVELTNNLSEISISEIIWKEEGNSIPESRYITSSQNNKTIILVAIDGYFLKTNPKNKDEGCCGNSNHYSFNKVCSNGHEVATEISDCWTGFYIEFDLNKVTIKEK